MTESLEALTARHAPTLESAIDAVNSRKNWSPFRDSPSAKFHSPGAPEAGKAAFEAQLGRPFDLDQPGAIGRSGEEVSPFTRRPLDIEYPVSDPAALISAAQIAREDWRRLAYETRIAICLEMAQRLYARNFEMAHSVMHVAGQSYTQAFSHRIDLVRDRPAQLLRQPQDHARPQVDRDLLRLLPDMERLPGDVRESCYRQSGDRETAPHRHTAHGDRGAGMP